LWFGHDDLWICGITLIGIIPFCAALGYLTPLLVDRYSGGEVGAASRAYAINVIGCIFGPLFGGYLLLPTVGERAAIIVLSLIPVAIGAWAVLGGDGKVKRLFVINLAVTALIAIGFKSYTENLPGAWVKRDHVATAVAFTEENGQKRLLVNGVGMTSQTTITKIMAHMPLASLKEPPRSALAICFGMGTTFRSLRSWGIKTTAVELVPSVPALYDYYIPGASKLIQPGVADVVIDDGRRFLERTRGQFDVITVDPPPPVQAAGSSLLYSREFYRAIKTRLQPNGILQHWLPTTDPSLTSSVVRSLQAEFPHVRAFGSFEGWGLHFQASMQPLERRSPAALLEKMPDAAKQDLAEWLPKETALSLLTKTLSNEVRPDTLTAKYDIAPLSDDRPTNEYFLLRELRALLK
jgi:spermidine synthase